MSDERPTPDTTLAITLGASSWPEHPSFEPSDAFRNSADAIRAYLLDQNGLALPRRNLKSIFDSYDDPPVVLDEIVRFLRTRGKELTDAGTSPRDLIVYYVGHGGFANPSSDFFLAMRSTRRVDPYISSLTANSLSNVLRQEARFLRKYLIIDSCFAASLHGVFMGSGGPVEVAGVKLTDALA